MLGLKIIRHIAVLTIMHICVIYANKGFEADKMKKIDDTPIYVLGKTKVDKLNLIRKIINKQVKLDSIIYNQFMFDNVYFEKDGEFVELPALVLIHMMKNSERKKNFNIHDAVEEIKKKTFSRELSREENERNIKIINQRAKDGKQNAK